MTTPTVTAQCRALHLPSVAARWESVEQEALRDGLTHSAYLAALFDLELEDRWQRRVQRRIKDAHFPALKRIADFQFHEAPTISMPLITRLAEGHYIGNAENILFVGDSGTGKTMLATGLGIAACEQGRRVRFTTVASIVNELLEARDEHSLSRVVNRWSRFDLIIADELGYVTLPPTGAELLFQVLAQRSESASVIITTNLPFGEWTNVFTDPRLCKAVLERLTYRSHIIETGTDSYRFKKSVGRVKSTNPGKPAAAPKKHAAVSPQEPQNDGPPTSDTTRNSHKEAE